VRQRLADLCQEILPREQEKALAAYHKARARQVMADHPGGGDQGGVQLANVPDRRSSAPL
jgi:hypothetical protein